MNKIRVQFIEIDNIPKGKDDENLTIRQKEHLSFHNYHIVFINYHTHGWTLPEIDEIMEYVSFGGVVVIFLRPNGYDSWPRKNFLNILNTSGGESIIPIPKCWLNDIFKKYNFTWHCLLEHIEELPIMENFRSAFEIMKGVKIPRKNNIFETAATTIVGKPVSAIIHYGNGKLILLPIPKSMTASLIRDILDGIEYNYPVKQDMYEITNISKNSESSHPKKIENFQNISDNKNCDVRKKKFIIYLDILGFKRLPAKIENESGFEENVIREKFFSEAVKEKIKEIREEYKVVCRGSISEIEGSDSYVIIFNDDFGKLLKIVTQLSTIKIPHGKYNFIPLEMVIGIIEDDMDSIKDPINSKSVNDFLNDDIVNPYRELYKKEHGDSPTNTFILLTSDAFEEIGTKLNCSMPEPSAKYYLVELNKPAKFEEKTSATQAPIIVIEESKISPFEKLIDKNNDSGITHLDKMVIESEWLDIKDSDRLKDTYHYTFRGELNEDTIIDEKTKIYIEKYNGPNDWSLFDGDIINFLYSDQNMDEPNIINISKIGIGICLIDKLYKIDRFSMIIIISNKIVERLRINIEGYSCGYPADVRIEKIKDKSGVNIIKKINRGRFKIGNKEYKIGDEISDKDINYIMLLEIPGLGFTYNNL